MSAHTILGSHTSAHMSAYKFFGAHTSAHMSLGAHTSQVLIYPFFAPRPYMTILDNPGRY